jgi:predicted nucleotidyltransferase
LSTVVIKSIDRGKVQEAVQQYARQLRQQHPEVTRVIWFGSWITGYPSPGSDVDICLVLSHSDLPIRERLPEYLPSRFPVGIDLHIYTQNELDHLRQSAAGWYQAINSGIDI